MKLRYNYLALLMVLIGWNLLTVDSMMAQVTSDITTNSTWTAAESPIVVSNTISISQGATLTIEPGVTVRMGSGASFLVLGGLVAEGTNTNRILFTSDAATPAAGDWGSIEFQNNTDVGSVFNYVTVEYGAGANRSGMVFYTTGVFAVNISNSVFRFSESHGINLRASSPTITNSEFHNNAGYGVFTDLALNYTVENSQIYNNVAGGIRVPINSAPLINNNTIENNGIGILIDNSGLPTITNNQILTNTTGIRVVEVGATKPTIKDNTISGNSAWGVENQGNVELNAQFNFWGSSLGPTVGTNPSGNGDKITLNVDYTPWRFGATDLPVVVVDANVNTNTTWSTGNVYHVTTNIVVTTGTTLTVEPGTVVKFANNVSMTVNGVLNANGTATDLIFFTSEKDDAAGGDSNGDGDASLPAPGDWGSININNTGSVISNAVIRFGFGNNGALTLSQQTSLSNLISSNNARHGIYSSVPQTGWVNVSAVDNNQYGIYMNQGNLEITGGNTSFNGAYGIYVTNSTIPYSLKISDVTSNYNGQFGIYLTGSGTSTQIQFESLTNSTISFNGSDGVRVLQSPGGITVSGNTIEGNGGHGVNMNHTGDRSNVLFQNNMLKDNAETGILSSQARFIDNTFEGNRFTIGAWEKLGHRYVNELGVDGNTFTGNTYNNALALYGFSLRDTLSATFPVAINSRTYLLADGSSSTRFNSADQELLIEPGVVIKSSSSALVNRAFRLDGKLTAVGTSEAPIVFTSLRDHDYGGNVNVAEDTLSAAPGDWSQFWLENSVAAESILKHIIIRYASTGLSLGNFTLGTPPDIIYTNDIEDVWVDQASGIGVNIRSAAVTLNRAKVTNSGQNGINLNNVGSTTTRAIVRNSEITGNGRTGNVPDAGLRGISGTAFTEISNSIIENNANGVNIDSAPLPVTLLGNQINNNSQHGVQVNSELSREDLAYIGNTVSGNTESGILSSQARFIDNTFVGNRYSIGAWQSLGHRYVDELGVDGNSFTGNTFNNALALYGFGLRDTLSATFPAAIDSRTYLLADGSSSGFNSANQELLIEPGVVIKSSNLTLVNRAFRLDGKLMAVGTSEAPIVFTSLRDHDYGGNVNIAEDTLSAAPGDWSQFWLENSVAAESMLKHIIIRYASTGLSLGSFTLGSPPDIIFTNDIEDMWVDQASGIGVNIRSAEVTFNRARVTNSGQNGINLNNVSSTTTRAIVRNSEITGNGRPSNTSDSGLRGVPGTVFTEISNSIIENNANGVRMDRAPLPVVVQSSTFGNSSLDGFFANLEEVESDTVLTITGNTFNQNGGVGLTSSRAIIQDNTFNENQIPIAIMGELSKEGTVNDLGNQYSGNTFLNNELADAIGVYSTSSIRLSGNLGFTSPSSFANPVHVPLQYTTDVYNLSNLVIAPGSVFKLGLNNPNENIRIQGNLQAIGNVDEKIVFTSILDDSFGGDTNRDGIDTVPGRGNWGGLSIDGAGSTNSMLKHVIIRYANNNLNFVNDTEAVIDSSFVSNATTGISVGRNSKPTIRNSDIHTNMTGISVASNADDPNIHLNNFYDNETAALSVSRNVTAIDNYWGDSTGPFVDQGSDLNIDGQGDRITMFGSNSVTYRPFLTDRTGILLGDVSENGAISGFDAALILQSVVGLVDLSPTQLAAADVSGDGSVTAMDASFILQYVVGSISGFPGAGKSPLLAPEDLFTIETVLEENYYDVMISSLGQIPVSAAELSVDFNSSQISHAELISSTETSDWTTLHHKTEGNLKAAVAGATYITEEANVLHVRFYLADEFTGGMPENLEIVSLRLNETDFSEYAGSLFTSLNEELNVPKEFVLDQNYPNPFNPTTVLRYSLPVSGEVSLDIFNSIGQKVATLVNSELQTSGNYSKNWNAANLASGVYFYRITVKAENGQGFTDVKKMMLIK